jgi:ankyrin repeat protein
MVQSSPSTARLLLEHGVDIDARTVHDFTPLNVAAESGRAKVARVLLKHGPWSRCKHADQ